MPRAGIRRRRWAMSKTLIVFDPEHLPHDHGTATELRDEIIGHPTPYPDPMRGGPRGRRSRTAHAATDLRTMSQ